MSDRQLATLPSNHFDDRLDEIRKVLPEGVMSAEALARVTLTAINKTPALRECSKASLLGCMLDLATIGLMPNTPQGFAYLIPYGGQATLQIGYKGYAELAYRSGQVKIIEADVVRDGDTFDYSKGTSAFVKHTKQIGVGRSECNVLAAWARVELNNGGNTIEVLDADELKVIRRKADAKKPSPAWKEFHDEMAKKTALKRLLKVLQVGNMPQIAQAIEIDNKHSDFAPAEPKQHRLIFDEPERLALETGTATSETSETRELELIAEERDEKGFVF